MPDRRDLYRKISNHIITQFDNPAERITEALLWRGFLVEKRANKILLFKSGTHDDDLKLLKEILPGPAFRIVSMENDNDHRAAISVPKKVTDGDILNILSSGSQPANGFTNPDVPVDVRSLDIGIALMVKRLPEASVHTIYSCDGFLHGDHYPFIDINDRTGCKQFIEAICRELEIDNMGTFNACRWQIADPDFDQKIDEAFEVFFDVQCVARHLTRSWMKKFIREKITH